MEDHDAYLPGRRIAIRALRRQDLETMSAWPVSDDPLYRLFDWPACSSVQNDIWFSRLVSDVQRVYYAVEKREQVLIGRVSLREIKRHWSARLGIGFGAPFVGQGYGTEALRLFLPYYFGDLGFERLALDVAAVNTRALRCYDKCGFKRVGSGYKGLGGYEDISFLQRPEYRHLKCFFKTTGYHKRMLFYDMILEKQDWQQEVLDVEGVGGDVDAQIVDDAPQAGDAGAGKVKRFFLSRFFP